MPYHIDEENSELAFEVREGNKLVIKIKSNIFSDSLELYLIKVGDNTEPTDKNVFSSLRVLKEIENLHDTILKEINSVTSGFWELKQDSQGNEYIATKYNVLTEGGLTTYGLGEQKLGTIYDGLPIDNDTIYWEEVEGSRVLKAKGSGGGGAGLDETKLWNVLGTPGNQQIDYSHLSDAFSQFNNDFVTIGTEQTITALKHFTAGLSIGSAKKKIYEKDGVLYIDSNVAITGALTMYATDGQSVSSIYDGLPIDNDTIYWGTVEGSRVLKAKGGSSFDENAMWSALSGSSNNQINKSHLTDALAGYATTEALNSVSNKLNDFLEGSDTDNIINKWKELEAFLSGMAETDNLAEILETKADKKYVDSTFVTLATKQTITGEKTFSSVLNTAAIKASGEITTPSLAASDYVTIAGIKLRKLEDGALMLEGNLALTGALTMYASNGQSFDTIYDGLPIDNDTIYWQEVDGSRVLKAREGSGSSFDKSAMWTALAGSTTEQINKSHLTTALTGYATESWVSGKNYAVKATTLAGYGITDGINAVSVTGTGNAVTAASISGHTLTLTKGATFNNYTHPTATATTITAANGKVLSAITVNNQGHVTSVSGKTLAAADIPTLEISKISGLQDSLDAKLESSAYTAADVLAKLKTVDGSNSGLDADLLDGTHKTALFTALTSSSATNISITVGGTTKSIADLFANSAAKLETARTLWGQSFDGTKNITGRFTSNERVYADKGIWVTNNDIAAWGQSKAALNLSIPNTSNTSGIICVYRSGKGNTGYTRFFSMEISNSSDSVRTYYANEVRIDITPTYMDINKRLNINGNTIIGSGGNLGIGTANPAAKLHVIGDILATGGGTYYGSDIRYKSIMQQVNLSLLDIAKAPSFVYRWNKKGMKRDRLNLGGSAQYTQLILPWAVEENDNFLSMDYATVAYTFAVHTARHLLTYESRTDKKIKKLENRVKYLEKQLKKLGYEEVRTLDDQSV